jgi:hypothetical protein
MPGPLFNFAARFGAVYKGVWTGRRFGMVPFWARATICLQAILEEINTAKTGWVGAACVIMRISRSMRRCHGLFDCLDTHGV